MATLTRSRRVVKTSSLNLRPVAKRSAPFGQGLLVEKVNAGQWARRICGRLWEVATPEQQQRAVDLLNTNSPDWRTIVPPGPSLDELADRLVARAFALQAEVPPPRPFDPRPYDAEDLAWLAGQNTAGDEDGPDEIALWTISDMEWWLAEVEMSERYVSWNDVGS